MGPAITSRIKIMAELDIAERRLPQDGDIHVLLDGRRVDLRVSTMSGRQGEKVVIRIIDSRNAIVAPERLGMAPQIRDQWAGLLAASNGVVLVTGPTGSGKSTSIAAMLQHVNEQKRCHIVTIEDPIEYNIDGISQIQVSNKKGLTFASGLRSLMRQDPDVMMVGEIRDGETAGISVQAANTGHLVFSTLHTNDSAGAITRLINLGVEPYLVASAVIAVIAQRLVRLTDNTLWRGRGCENCLGRGLFDRTAIYEIFAIDEAARDQIIERTSASIVKQSAVQRGLQTLRMDGARKVVQGHTTIEEVFRVTQLDVF